MGWLIDFLKWTHVTVETPKAFGVFHLAFTFGGITAIILVLFLLRKGGEKQHRIVFLAVGIFLLIIEIYKQLYLTFVVSGYYRWDKFPFHMCSIPMYFCLIVPFLKPGKIRTGMLGVLATYGLVSGISVLAAPLTSFSENLTMNIHTLLWHVILLFLSVYTLSKGLGCKNFKEFLYSFYIFLALMIVALIMDLIAYPLLQAAGSSLTFNMFFVSPYYITPLILLNSIQKINYVLFLISYIVIFSGLSFLVQIASNSIRVNIQKRKLKNKD